MALTEEALSGVDCVVLTTITAASTTHGCSGARRSSSTPATGCVIPGRRTWCGCDEAAPGRGAGTVIVAIAAGRTAGDRSIIAIAVAGGALVARPWCAAGRAGGAAGHCGGGSNARPVQSESGALPDPAGDGALARYLDWGVPVRVEDLLMVPLAIGWLAHLCVTHEREGTPLDRLLIAYALVAFAATAWGMHLGTVHLFSVSKYVSSSFQVLKRVEFVLLFLIVADTVRTTRDVRTMSYVLIGSAVALSIYAAQQYANNGAIALGPEGAPIHEPGFASMLTVALALGMSGARPTAASSCWPPSCCSGSRRSRCRSAATTSRRPH